MDGRKKGREGGSKERKEDRHRQVDKLAKIFALYMQSNTPIEKALYFQPLTGQFYHRHLKPK